MKLEYKNLNSKYQYTSISWVSKGKTNSLSYNSKIIALYSKQLKKIIIEDCKKKQLHFYEVNGELLVKKKIPLFANYQYWGINKNNLSKTGITLLYLPLNKEDKNEWGDIFQFELNDDVNNLVGKKLGIYR